MTNACRFPWLRSYRITSTLLVVSLGLALYPDREPGYKDALTVIPHAGWEEWHQSWLSIMVYSISYPSAITQIAATVVNQFIIQISAELRSRPLPMQHNRQIRGARTLAIVLPIFSLYTVVKFMWLKLNAQMTNTSIRKRFVIISKWFANGTVYCINWTLTQCMYKHR